MKRVTLLTFVTVALVAALHVLRLLLRIEVTVGGVAVPLWASVPAILLFAGLAVGLWREHPALGAPNG